MVLFGQIQTQAQVIAPQLRQSLKVLQASAFDLRTFIQEEMRLNPTLEGVFDEAFELENDKSSSLIKTDNFYERTSTTDKAAAAKQHEFLMNSLTSEVSLQDHLREQVACLELSKKLRKIISFIIGSLNEKGFLDLSADELVFQTGSNHKSISKAISIIQQLDPIGIGCKDVPSSLLVQLKHQNKEHSLAFRIINECYTLLLHNKLAEIARYFSLKTEEVQQAVRNDITPLNPTPGNIYLSRPSQGIIPDVHIYKNHLNEWMVELNNRYVPHLRISNTYKNMLAQDIKPEDRHYLQLKMRSGRCLIQAILQRQKTIEQISRALLLRQQDFFEHGITHLKPLTLQILAEDLCVHETTVSRATANKYIETPFGIFSFKYFFTKGLNSTTGDTISSFIVKQQIQRIVKNEDKRKPLSDQKIAALLAKNQVQIARRTVTKYRESLGILAASLRKKYN